MVGSSIIWYDILEQLCRIGTCILEIIMNHWRVYLAFVNKPLNLDKGIHEDDWQEDETKQKAFVSPQCNEVLLEKNFQMCHINHL